MVNYLSIRGNESRQNPFRRLSFESEICRTSLERMGKSSTTDPRHHNESTGTKRDGSKTLRGVRRTTTSTVTKLDQVPVVSP